MNKVYCSGAYEKFLDLKYYDVRGVAPHIVIL
jgi:hypothetical protein